MQAQGYAFTPVADQFDWTYYVVNSETPNAFCLPGGYVAVYTGILDITGIKPISLIELGLGSAIGALTFTGSVIA